MWLEILTGTILIIAILQGYRNGFIKAVISFFSLMIGLILAFQFAGSAIDQKNCGRGSVHTNTVLLRFAPIAAIHAVH